MAEEEKKRATEEKNKPEVKYVALLVITFLGMFLLITYRRRRRMRNLLGRAILKSILSKTKINNSNCNLNNQKI